MMMTDSTLGASAQLVPAASRGRGMTSQHHRGLATHTHASTRVAAAMCADAVMADAVTTGHMGNTCGNGLTTRIWAYGSTIVEIANPKPAFDAIAFNTKAHSQRSRPT
ncbi:MAG: hypothetical protein R2733_08495 [Acidimicrobiales bacterium]